MYCMLLREIWNYLKFKRETQIDKCNSSPGELIYKDQRSDQGWIIGEANEAVAS